MTSSDAVPRASVLPSGVGARLVAAATALLLALTVLVAPGARAADDAPPVTITVVQDETWREGFGERSLAATAFGPDGEPVTGGEYAVYVAPEVRFDVPWTDGRLTFDVGRLAVGPLVVSVAWRPADGQPWTSTKTTFEVVPGTIPSAVTVVAPSSVAYRDVAYADVSVDVPGGPRGGEVEIFRADGSTYALYAARIDPATGTGRLRIPSGGPGTTNRYGVVFYGQSGVATSRTTLTVKVGKTEPQIRLTTGSPDDGRWLMRAAPWSVHVDLGQQPITDGTVSLHDEKGRLLASRAASAVRNGNRFLDVRADQLSAGRHRLEVRLTGSSTVTDGRRSVDVTVTKEKAEIRTSGLLGPSRWGRPHALPFDVVDAYDTGGARRTGTVTVYHGKKMLWKGSLTGWGTGTARLGGKALPAGRSTLRIVYSGDRYFAPATLSRSVRVAKAPTKARVKVLDRHIEASEKPRVKVRITAPSGITPTGKIDLKIDGKVVKTVRLKKKHDGVRTVTLPRLERGEHSIKAVIRPTATMKRSISLRSGRVWVGYR